MSLVAAVVGASGLAQLSSTILTACCPCHVRIVLMVCATTVLVLIVFYSLWRSHSFLSFQTSIPPFLTQWSKKFLLYVSFSLSSMFFDVIMLSKTGKGQAIPRINIPFSSICVTS